MLDYIVGNSTLQNALNWTNNGGNRCTVSAASGPTPVGNVYQYTVTLSVNTAGGTYTSGGYVMDDGNFSGFSGGQIGCLASGAAMGHNLAAADLAGMNGVLVTPVMQVPGTGASANYQSGPRYGSNAGAYGSLSVTLSTAGIAAGTTSGVTLTMRFRNLSMRVIDPVNGEPY